MSAFHWSKRWARLRKRVLDAGNWRCKRCGRYGNEVDHIRAIEHGGEKWEVSNLQVLCRTCHILKTQHERGVKPIPGAKAWDRVLKHMV